MHFAAKDKKSKTSVGAPIWLNFLWSLVVPTVFLFMMELVHRNGLPVEDFWQTRFSKHFISFFLGWLFLTLLYHFVTHLTARHWPAALVVGLLCNFAGIVTKYKLEMRGEPLLPWDFTQIDDLMGVSDNLTFTVDATVIISACVFIALFIISFFIKMPYQKGQWKWRTGFSVVSAICLIVLTQGVFLNSSACESLHIYSDMWMQDRYYKNYGIITGFITNLRVLNIETPNDYSDEAVTQLVIQTKENAKTQKPLYANSYAATQSNPEQQPNIIYVMNESFWDVSRLEGITYDRELTPNLQALSLEGAYGRCYTPSFGGGTCDVEFEALTGFSLEHLPAGSKPYQQYATKDMFSLPQYLKEKGYSTVAIHGYYRKFWSRNTAYPNLGIDTFVAAEDFTQPDKRRGFISDAAMTQRIIEEYENRTDNGPVFIHAVTMQNHTTYDASRYPADEIVQITDYPAGMSDTTISQLQDFATGVHEADSALGTLIEYFQNVEEPTIIVFWGDHYNPLGKGYELFEMTNYIEKGDTSSPNLRQTDLLMWSNYDTSAVSLGTIAAYQISPVMMDLYGLEKPVYFEFLAQEFSSMHARTRGITVNPDNSLSEEMTEAQQIFFDNQWILQYNLMFDGTYTAKTPLVMPCP